ncbi:MAG TPA: acetyl-CoA carboxylase carboxyltransferase subunit alpha [bacterium]|nr:acetyl-CoA carboxylase carboxyltransferase subunit alpha [bacterium]
MSTQVSDAPLMPADLPSPEGRPDAAAPAPPAAPAGDALERTLVEVEREIRELRKITTEQRMDLNSQIAILETRAQALREAIARDPSPWQTVQLARHPERPKVGDYIAALARDFVELHGDRMYRDDPAIVAGLGWIDTPAGGGAAALIGHAKGRDTRENIARNFAMPNPEGYRKAVRVMKLAEKLRCPVVTLIDTPGAYPGKEAEERGQSEAIARALLEMARLRTPIVTVITGEGGSGGALAIGIGDAVLMLEHAVYSVISPEGCAAILWRDGTRSREAAAALRITARDLAGFGIVDEVIPEPPGGAHTNRDAAVTAVAGTVRRQLALLLGHPLDALLDARYEKFRRIGRVREMDVPAAPPGGAAPAVTPTS